MQKSGYDSRCHILLKRNKMSPIDRAALKEELKHELLEVLGYTRLRHEHLTRIHSDIVEIKADIMALKSTLATVRVSTETIEEYQGTLANRQIELSEKVDKVLSILLANDPT